MRRLVAVLLIVAAAAMSGGCWVQQDQNGQWWACDNIQTPQGTATGCYPIHF